MRGVDSKDEMTDSSGLARAGGSRSRDIPGCDYAKTLATRNQSSLVARVSTILVSTTTGTDRGGDGVIVRGLNIIEPS